MVESIEEFWEDKWKRLKEGYLKLSPIIARELEPLEWKQVPKIWQEDFKKRIIHFFFLEDADKILKLPEDKIPEFFKRAEEKLKEVVE
jgi:hypothetical protein